MPEFDLPLTFIRQDHSKCIYRLLSSSKKRSNFFRGRNINGDRCRCSRPYISFVISNWPPGGFVILVGARLQFGRVRKNDDDDDEEFLPGGGRLFRINSRRFTCFCFRRSQRATAAICPSASSGVTPFHPRRNAEVKCTSVLSSVDIDARSCDRKSAECSKILLPVTTAWKEVLPSNFKVFRSDENVFGYKNPSTAARTAA